MPSHTWPVMTVPVTASISCLSAISVLAKRNACGGVELALARRPQRISEHDEEDRDEIEEPPGLGKLGERLVERVHPGTSTNVGFVVVELEINERAEHLQI